MREEKRKKKKREKKEERRKAGTGDKYHNIEAKTALTFIENSFSDPWPEREREKKSGGHAVAIGEGSGNWKNARLLPAIRADRGGL